MLPAVSCAINISIIKNNKNDPQILMKISAGQKVGGFIIIIRNYWRELGKML